MLGPVSLPWASLTIPPAAVLNAAGRVRRIAGAGARAPVRLTYGSDRLGADILNVLLTSAGGSTIVVQCLWGFAAHAIADVRLNELELPAGASVTHYTGSQTTPDATLVAAFAAQGITYTDTLEGYAYSVAVIPVRVFDGQLNITARVSGRKVYDPRKDTTAGGSGAHRLDNPATWEWSDNPALADGDFLSNTVYGAGKAVDWASVATAADACDTLIGSPAEKRRVVGVTFSAPISVRDTAEALRAYSGCWHVPTVAGVKLLPDLDGAASASYAHAAGQIAAIDALQVRDMGDAPTAVEVIFTDTSVIPWREDSATASLEGAGTTLPWRLSQVRMPGVHRYSQAYREAIERLNKLRLGFVSTTLDVFDAGIQHDTGDIVTVTHPVGLSGTPMRVQSATMVSPGRWRLAVTLHDGSAYSTAVATRPTSLLPSFLNPAAPPENVASLAGAVGQGIITWAWLPCDSSSYAETELRLGGTSWADATFLWAGRASTFLQRVTETGSVTIRARHRNADGSESAAATSQTVTVDPEDLAASGLSVYTATVYKQQTDQPDAPTGGSFDFTTAALTAPTGWQTSQPNTTTTPTWASEFTFNTTTPSAPVTGGTWGSPYIDAVTGAGGSGVDGQSVLIFEIYREAASAPPTPTGGSYNFNTDAFTAPSGWSRSMPTVGTTPVWRSTFRFSTSTPTVAVNAGTWAAPVLFAQRGADGADGEQGPQGPQGPQGVAGTAGASVAEFNVYRRATSPPATPTGGSFNFSTNVLTSPSGWSSAVPAGTDPVYVSRGLASTATPGGTATPTWSAAGVAFENGQSVDVIFRRSASQPATPGASAGVPANWYSSVGDVPAGADPLWSSFGERIGSSANWVWQEPVRVQGVDGPQGPQGPQGVAGEAGTSVAELNVYRRSTSAPSAPSGGTFNFSNQTLTVPSGWSVGVPSGTDPVYVARGLATTAVIGGSVTPTWGSPVLAFANGQAVDVIFRRSASQPATPTASSGVPSGWYSSVGSVPAGADPLWSSFGERAAVGLNWTWQVPVRVQGLDGAQGPTGPQGNPGTQQAVAYLYQWASGQPGNPSGSTTWAWASGANINYTGAAGWAVSPTANPGTPGLRLWVASKSVTATAGVTTTTVSWSSGFTVYAVSVNGADGPQGATGTPGVKAATPTVYRWAATIPTISGSATYNWASASLSAVPSGWSATPGTGSPGQTLWGAQVQLVESAGAATSSVSWASASITARGYAGANGPQGPQGAAGVSGADGNDGLGYVGAGWAPGKVGGSGDFVFFLDQISPTVVNVGEIYVQATRFNHPDGAPRTVGLQGMLATPYGEGTAGRFYIAYTQEAKATRFPGVIAGGAPNLFLVRRKGPTTWETFSNVSGDGAATFTPLATDCILAVVEAETASSGLTAITPFVAGAAGLDGATGPTGPTGQTGISARRAYVLTTAASLGTGTVTTTGINSLPGTGTVFGSGLSWSATPGVPAVGQQLFQSDGLYNPATNKVTWETPYLSALKVGNLAAIAVNTGALTVNDTLTVGSGGIAVGSINWNTSTGVVNSGSGVAITANGIAARNSGGQITFALDGTTGAATFAGALSAATGTFAGALSAATGTFNGTVKVNTATVSGTTMTGSGAVLNSNGTFALGNATRNISFNGTTLTVNGPLVVTGNLVADAVSETSGVSATNPTGGGPGTQLAVSMDLAAGSKVLVLAGAVGLGGAANDCTLAIRRYEGPASTTKPGLVTLVTGYTSMVPEFDGVGSFTGFRSTTVPLPPWVDTVATAGIYTYEIHKVGGAGLGTRTLTVTQLKR